MITRAIIVFLMLLFAAGCWLSWRLIGIGKHKGQRRAPRGYAEADERLASTLERVIPRAVTENAPPWDPAPVIEPDAITHGPPAQPVPADMVLTAVRSGGQLTKVHVAILPPLPEPSWPGELHPEVAADLGYPTVADALASMYRRADALELREKLTDGAS